MPQERNRIISTGSCTASEAELIVFIFCGCSSCTKTLGQLTPCSTTPQGVICRVSRGGDTTNGSPQNAALIGGGRKGMNV